MSKTLDVSKLKNNDYVHCKTEKRARRLLKALYEVGFRWNGERENQTDNWHCYKEETCYFIENNLIYYGRRDVDYNEVKYKSLLVEENCKTDEKVEEKAVDNKTIDVSKLKSNDYIHCKTEKKAKRLLKALHKSGFEWINGELLIECSYWDNFREETCYYIEDNIVFYGRLYGRKDEDYNQVKYESLMIDR